jgi:hypothetical protein
MAEMTIYLVVTEQYYGGEQRSVFLTLEAARIYRAEILATIENELDVIIQEFSLHDGRVVAARFCD